MGDSVQTVRDAFEALATGSTTTLLDLVDADFEWTFLDPAVEDPEPQVCRGREELAIAMQRIARSGLSLQLEEVLGAGDKVMVTVHIPGIDRTRARKADDRNYDVVTVLDGRIVAMRACKDRDEALRLAGLS
jgi:ketosteroid isomerase-like protein